MVTSNRRRVRSAEGLTRGIVDRLFARPRGLLGVLGGALMARTNADAARWTLSRLEVRPGDRVLEVGFGPGVGLRYASRVTDGLVAGVDPSAVMVRRARARNATAVRDGRVALARGSATHLPYADASFDAAFSVNSVQVWPDAAAGVRELHRVVKPGGSVALTVTNRAGLSSDSLEAWLEGVGFERLRIDRRNDAVCVRATRAD